MSADFSLPILITFIIYGCFVYFIAVWTARGTKNTADYMLAGRKLNGWLTALGAGASDMSSWLLMALPGTVYLFGLSAIWYPVALSIGAYLNWRIVGKRLRVYTEVANDSLTLPSYFDNRFKSKDNKLRLVTALAIIVFFTMYSVAGFVSGAVLTQYTFGLSYTTSLYISAFVIIIYTAIGGFLAVNRIDFFQGCLMFFALLLVPIVTILNLNGVNETFNIIKDSIPDRLEFFSNLKALGIISLVAWGIGYFGQPHILVRFMAIRSTKELPLARRVCMTWMVTSLIGAVLTGIVGAAYFIEAPLTNPETVFIKLSSFLFNPWVTGILLSAILSAIMSTISAQILMSGSVIAEDFYKGLLRKNASQKEYLWVSKISVFVIALIAVWIASDPKLTILGSVGFAWSGLGASFGAVILFSLYWKRMNKYGAIAGVLVGGASVITFKLLSTSVGGIFAHPDILPGFSILPGFLLSSLAIVFVSLATSKPSKEILLEFEESVALVKNK